MKKIDKFPDKFTTEEEIERVLFGGYSSDPAFMVEGTNLKGWLKQGKGSIRKGIELEYENESDDTVRYVDKDNLTYDIPKSYFNYQKVLDKAQ